MCKIQRNLSTAIFGIQQQQQLQPVCSPRHVYSVRRRVCENREGILIIYAFYITQGMIHHKHTMDAEEKSSLQITRCMQSNKEWQWGTPRWPHAGPEETSPRQDVSKLRTRVQVQHPSVFVHTALWEHSEEPCKCICGCLCRAEQNEYNEYHLAHTVRNRSHLTLHAKPLQLSISNSLGFQGSVTLQWCQTWVAELYI